MTGKATLSLPKIQWERLDMSPVMFAIAGDGAAAIKQRVRGGAVKPMLKARTIEQKRKRGYIAPETPLFATGLMVNSITHRKVTTVRNCAEIYVRDNVQYHRAIEITSRGGRTRWISSTQRAVSNALRRGGRITQKAHRRGGKAGATPRQVAYYHDEAGAGRKKIKRPFFYLTDSELYVIAALRIKQGIGGALRRAGITT